MTSQPVPDYSKYDNEYLYDYKETENFDPGLPFQDIPVTETEEDNEPPGPPPEIILRDQWGAGKGGDQGFFTSPVENVIYSYTETKVCKDKEECVALMKEMQTEHIKEGYPDIKFNFVIGGDGRVYEGTGWKVRAPKNEQYPDLEGNHIEFSHTGYREDFPSKAAVKLINRLYDYGIEKGHVHSDSRVCIDYMWPTD